MIQKNEEILILRNKYIIFSINSGLKKNIEFVSEVIKNVILICLQFIMCFYVFKFIGLSDKLVTGLLMVLKF